MKSQKENIEKIEIPETISASIKIKEGIILTSVKLNGKVKQFIVDSGAPSMVLNSKYITRSENSDEKKFKGISGQGTSFTAYIKNFSWNNFKLKNYKALAIDFSHLETALKENIYGLIGYKELSMFTFLIDYKNAEITLWRDFSKHKKSVKKSLPFVLQNHLPVLKFFCGNLRLNLALDTGAAHNVIDIALKKKLKGKFSTGKESSLQGASTESLKVKEIYLNEIKSDLITLKKFPAIWHDISHIKNESIEIDGLMGYRFLKKGKFAVSYSDSKIYLLK